MSLEHLSMDGIVDSRMLGPFFLILPMINRANKDLGLALLKSEDEKIVCGQPKSFKIGMNSR